MIIRVRTHAEQKPNARRWMWVAMTFWYPDGPVYLVPWEWVA